MCTCDTPSLFDELEASAAIDAYLDAVDHWPTVSARLERWLRLLDDPTLEPHERVEARRRIIDILTDDDA